MPFTKNDERMEYIEPKEHHIPYARLQLIARDIVLPSEEDDAHLIICEKCRSAIDRMQKATMGV